MEATAFIIPAFIAGILTFLAPCTLPLVPAYLSFISGASAADLRDPKKALKARAKVFMNGVFYVVGFSLVFIILGSLFGLGGGTFLQYRPLITKIGGLLVIFFGLFLLLPALNVLLGGKIPLSKIPLFSFFARDHQLAITKKLKPGNPLSSFLLGVTFAFGWTPCVGPILAVILTFAASSATVGSGTLLLIVFSAGLAIPFLLVALGIGWALKHLSKASKYLNWVSIIGGLFLILMGIFMLTDNFTLWIATFSQVLDFINYDSILEYL
ncbi:sulfite exporter TauE/SafE family protein [Patescibacteria group bacterium]|nr:sulfite exporter TauE/SafE family protein [Patescibacteria group bacterium]